MVKKEPAEPEARTSAGDLLVLEVVFVLVGVAGLALWSVPAALVVAGVLGVLACERAMSRADRRAAGAGRGREATGGERT
ncbi:hypothetical protein [Streptomyces sp. STR69]|uniref:hypothetical protein n=1 Tax=Streptomyces sp. STR69 TaxID=1796942 RepID=UPI0021C92B20|nr:hypothetical protein [Streptomyces sp. STR69]